jgi:hypothetical protein
MSASSAARHRAAKDGLSSSLLFEMSLLLSQPIAIGEAPDGRRVLLGAEGGFFKGPTISGVILPQGGDWALVRPDGGLSLDIRLVLQADDGAAIFMTGGGRFTAPSAVLLELRDQTTRHLVDPAMYYFRTPFQFETGAPAHARLNNSVCIGVGRLAEHGVMYQVYEVL